MTTSITSDVVQIDDVLSFTVYGGGAVPNITDGKLIGIISGQAIPDTAVVSVDHSNVYPTIPTPNDVPSDYREYNFWTILKSDNTIVNIGIPWIDPVSITRQDRTTVTVTVRDFDLSRKKELATLLAHNGFRDITIS